MMRRISLGLLAATAMGLIASQGALAADLRAPVKAPPPALPPPVQDWSGVYVGLEGGYGWGKENLNPAFDPFFFSSDFEGPNATIGSVSQSGWLFGGFVGAQKQWGSWVLGIEADFDAADIKGTTNASRSFCGDNLGGFICGGGTSIIPVGVAETEQQHHSIESKIDELASVRGKVGWAWSPNWMFYGTGGLALAHTEDNHSFSQVNQVCIFNLTICGTPFGPTPSNLTAGTSRFGWAAGAGLDYKWQIDQGSAVVFGVEYLHYQFEGDNRSLGDAGGFALQTNSSLSVDTIKGRISYLFSIH